jgi:small-conductance mechanosensitive channel/CRP-like cAMP-binding protein
MNRSLRGVGPLLVPAILFSLLAIFAASGDALPSFLALPLFLDGRPVHWLVIQTGLWLSAGWLLSRMVNIFVWDGAVSRAIGGRVPGLIKTISSGVIACIAATGVVGVVFGLPITGFFATSSVVGLVVGFALRNIINDIFTGVALNIDRGFRIGDWVTVHSGTTDIVGQVAEINWRTTRIATEDNTIVILPNGSLGQMIVTNHWGRGREVRFDLDIALDPTVLPDRARRIFLGAVRAVTGRSGILDKPDPQVHVTGPTDAGVNYRLRYWIRPWEASSPSTARDVVVRSVLSHLRQAGISPAYPKEELYVSRSAPRSLDSSAVADREELLSRIPVFHDLSDLELKTLAGGMRQRTFASGTVLYCQGDPGSSMFVVVEGVLAATVRRQEGTGQEHAAQFVPGDFFGEFSLLTGDTREATVSATHDSVVFEITKAQVDELCARRPELVETLATALVDRMVNISRVVEGSSDEPNGRQQPHRPWNLVRMVKNTFRVAFKRSGESGVPQTPADDTHPASPWRNS